MKLKVSDTYKDFKLDKERHIVKRQDTIFYRLCLGYLVKTVEHIEHCPICGDSVGFHYPIIGTYRLVKGDSNENKSSTRLIF